MSVGSVQSVLARKQRTRHSQRRHCIISKFADFPPNKTLILRCHGRIYKDVTHTQCTRQKDNNSAGNRTSRNSNFRILTISSLIVSQSTCRLETEVLPSFGKVHSIRPEWGENTPTRKLTSDKSENQFLLIRKWKFTQVWYFPIWRGNCRTFRLCHIKTKE